jgi:TPR repeat protein
VSASYSLMRAVAIIRESMSALRLFLGVALTALAAAPGARAQADDEVERAFAAALRRANAGDVVAQFSLGSLLYYGSKDTAQSVNWLRRAAAQLYAPAEFQLGLMYDFGFGVAQNDTEALGWYRQAARHGSAPGQRTIGDFYRKGRGVAVDLAEALRWYQRAAEADDIRAQYQLGDMYFNGTGIARDYSVAYFWFSIAAGQAPLLDNRKQLIEMRNIAAVRMTPEAVKEAERRVTAWRPGR